MSKKISYANAVRRTTSLQIEKIPIKKWLKHYGLETFYHTIFVEKHNMYRPYTNIEYPYEYSHLLTSIKTNVDLLFSFPYSFKFKEAISVPVQRKLYEMVYDGLITQDESQDGKVENRFFKAFELLLSQKKEYKAMLSVFGLKPSKSKYNSILEKKLEFLDHQHYQSKYIFKSEIISKLKLLSFDDLLHCNQAAFNLLLSLPIQEIEKYMIYTTNKLVNIKNGLKATFTPKQFNSFIDNNKSLKVFESCYNNYDLKYVNLALKTNFDAYTLLSAHRMDLLVYFFNPPGLIDSEITEKIHATLFPDNDHIYIEQQFNRINENIPKTPITDDYIKQNKHKMRVFFIQGHGAACTIADYEKKDRVDFEKVFKNIKDRQEKEYKWSHSSKIYRYNANKFNNISTQPVGRKSIFTIIVLLNKILSSQYRNVFLQGLINANKLEHLRILENIVHMYYSHYCIKLVSKEEDDKTLPEYFKKSKLTQNTSQITNSFYKFPKTNFTSSDIVNFVKYNYNHTPVNTVFYFETNVLHQGLMGIFELNEDNANDFIKLDDKIISTRTKDNKLKMGLKLNKVYDFKGDIPVRAEEILKYNKALTPKSSNTYTLEELMAHIYLVGNIKSDEHVVIFDNSCRGLKRAVGTAITNSNTVSGLPPILKGMAQLARMTSLEQSLEPDSYDKSLHQELLVREREKRAKRKTQQNLRDNTGEHGSSLNQELNGGFRRNRSIKRKRTKRKKKTKRK